MTLKKNHTFDFRRSANFDKSFVSFESSRYETTDNDKRIKHLPYELISIFLLSQNNNDSVLKFYSFGEENFLKLKNIEKSGKGLAEVLHGISENQYQIRRELRMLSGEYISADGLPLAKTVIETLVKIYDIYYKKAKNRDKTRISIRELIESVIKYTYDKKCNGEEKVRILIHILLLSTVSISSHIYDREKKPILSRSKLFYISSDNFTKDSEIIQLLSDKAKEKLDKKEPSNELINGKNAGRVLNGGKKTGRVMDACKEIFIDFRNSAFEKLAAKHNVIIKKKLKARGQYFSYNLAFNNQDARLCAVLDLVTPYSRELNSEGSAVVLITDKTFSLDCIVELMGISSQIKERKDRFYKSLRLASSVFGKIQLYKNNLQILFNVWSSAAEDTQESSVGVVGNQPERPKSSVGVVGNQSESRSDLSVLSVGVVGNQSESRSDLSVLSVGVVGNVSTCSYESKKKEPIVDQSNLIYSNTSKGKLVSRLNHNSIEFTKDIKNIFNKLSREQKKSIFIQAKRSGVKRLDSMTFVKFLSNMAILDTISNPDFIDKI